MVLPLLECLPPLLPLPPNSFQGRINAFPGRNGLYMYSGVAMITWLVILLVHSENKTGWCHNGLE